jgi:hypothetical protein
MTLNPIGSNQNELELQNGTRVLFSYSTPVAAHVPGKGYMRTATKYSKTTSKHITQWLARHGAHEVATAPQSEIDALTNG